MIFARLVVKVCRALPLKGKIGLYLLLLVNYGECLEKVKKWHKAELEELDPVFRAQQDSLRLISTREKARPEGIGPMDPNYPPLIDPHQRAEFIEAVANLFEVSGRPVRPKRFP